MPPDPTTQNLVDAEAVAVAYCIHPYNNTRPMPDGFIKTSHFVRPVLFCIKHFQHTDSFLDLA